VQNLANQKQPSYSLLKEDLAKEIEEVEKLQTVDHWVARILPKKSIGIPPIRQKTLREIRDIRIQSEKKLNEMFGKDSFRLVLYFISKNSRLFKSLVSKELPQPITVSKARLSLIFFFSTRFSKSESNLHLSKLSRNFSKSPMPVEAYTVF